MMGTIFRTKNQTVAIMSSDLTTVGEHIYNESGALIRLISFCSEYQPQVRVYLSHSYGGASIALIEDLNC